MPRTALIVTVPEAQPAVADGSAAPGVPAHITILYPFADAADVDEAAVAEVVSSVAAFTFALDRVDRFEGGLVWLHPEPSEPFSALTHAVWRRFPDYPPYGGAHETVIPHLTIGMDVEVDIELPIHTAAREVTLIEEDAHGRWSLRCVFPLQGVA